MANEKSTSTLTPAQKRLLILSFFEGSCVMVAELAGGKMLAPYYGTSLYVWASTLAITLGALTIGYYLGGEFSKREPAKRQRSLFLTLAIASALVILMPVIASFIMTRTLEMDFLTGLVISQMVFMFPPVLGMGIVSPLLIGMLGDNNNSGKAAGQVYAISTLGGVIATLLTGFWLVPVIGISIPCVVAGSLLFVLNIILLGPKNKIVAGIYLLALVAPSVLFISGTRRDNSDKYKVLYHNEGMLGQVKVVDFDYVARQHTVKARVMLVNHNWQTWIDREHPDFSFLYYTRFSRAVISSMPAGSRALLIGLGGGTVARQLERYNVNYDAVEIDGRLPGLAEKYFQLKKAIASTSVDDGRHFINVCKKKYDLIIIDALLGESVPSHLLSVECFTKLQTLMNPHGKIFIEFDGINEGEDGMAQQMLLNSISKAGYQCRIFSSLPPKTDADLMYVATTDGNKTYDTAVIEDDFYYPIGGPLKKFEVHLDMQTAKVVTDNNQVLDFYLKERVAHFRQRYLLKYNEEFIDDQMPFFY